jgi:hypothetical protein
MTVYLSEVSWQFLQFQINQHQLEFQ